MFRYGPYRITLQADKQSRYGLDGLPRLWTQYEQVLLVLLDPSENVARCTHGVLLRGERHERDIQLPFVGLRLDEDRLRFRLLEVRLQTTHTNEKSHNIVAGKATKTPTDLSMQLT